MASRVDEMRAYRFAVRRVTAATITRQVDTMPPRRATAATLTGFAIVLVALAASVVYGAVAPRRAGDWRRADAVIVEKETGARYVFLDGALHPVPNYASARLIVGSPAPVVIPVARRDLAAVDRGAPLGIAGAPDSIPGPADLLPGTWTACSDAAIVVAGGAGGQPLGTRAVLGVAPDGIDYLIWRNRRDRIRDPGIVLAAFGWTGAVPVPVATAFVAALPPGPDLARIAIDRRGTRSAVPGLIVGEVVTSVTQSGIRQFAVVLPAGLADVSAITADILLNDPRTPGTGRAVDVAGQVFASAEHSALAVTDGWPKTVPVLDRSPHTICVPVAGEDPAVVVDAVVADAAGATGVAIDPPAGYARVVVPPGHGALVRAAGGLVCLVTDEGVRYPIDGADALASLGYADVAPVTVPAAILALLPSGVHLSRALARAAISE